MNRFKNPGPRYVYRVYDDAAVLMGAGSRSALLQIRAIYRERFGAELPFVIPRGNVA